MEYELRLDTLGVTTSEGEVWMDIFCEEGNFATLNRQEALKLAWFLIRWLED